MDRRTTVAPEVPVRDLATKRIGVLDLGEDALVRWTTGEYEYLSWNRVEVLPMYRIPINPNERTHLIIFIVSLCLTFSLSLWWLL